MLAAKLYNSILVDKRSHSRFLQNIRSNARGDPLRRLMNWVRRQMGVARCRLNSAVAEQLTDHRQGLAHRQGALSKSKPDSNGLVPGMTMKSGWEKISEKDKIYLSLNLIFYIFF